jgi:uncharacterized membrane protein YidH (DUF202 family)
MHGSGIAIWFFIGVLLVVYGGMISIYGVYEWMTASYPAGVQLTNLHTPVWWGGILLVIGLLYVVKFRPRQSSK